VKETDAIRVPCTRTLNARLTHALGTLLSLALLGGLLPTFAALTCIVTEVVAVAVLPPTSLIVVLMV
jgi:uncharacterized membrane protein YphA (DoxX/SURF4 family)